MSKINLGEAIPAQGILPLFYHDSLEISLKVMETLYISGIKIIEYTNRGEQALDNFRQCVNILEKSCPDLQLGIGTITSVYQAESFVAAGAKFLVSPVVDAKLADFSRSNDVGWIPGAMTPTEIHQAVAFQVPLIKIFPANVGGPAFLSAIRDVFPGQRFMPTGGVELSKSNLKSWFKSGACAVGLGSKLITKELLADENFNLLELQTRMVMDNITNVRS